MRSLKTFFRAGQHRILALMLTCCLLIGIVPNMGIVALAAGETATSVIVGDATLSADRPYLVNGTASAGETLGAGDDAANANDITYGNQKYVKMAPPIHTHCICGGAMSDHTGHESVTYRHTAGWQLLSGRGCYPHGRPYHRQPGHRFQSLPQRLCARSCHV